ncbi:MAG: TspO/MBR family protein [Candidatus Eremiobacterota bacterium]
MKKITILILFLVICFLTAAFGSYFTVKSVSTWYLTIEKPLWNPPSWVFGPVWTILYILIALSGWLVWMKGSEKPVRIVLFLYFIQIFLNAIWSPIFFGLHNPFLAFIDICLLWIFIVIYMYFSCKISLPACILFIPYLAWVTFASILNFAIWRLNI